MSSPDSARLEYESSQETIDLLRYTCETLSLGFDRWDEQYVGGPSLYFVVAANVDFADHTDPLGENRWPVNRCNVVMGSSNTFVQAARDVAFTCDGAVLVAGDGTIHEQMVRVRTPYLNQSEGTTVENYADWMGTKHLSALEVSTREEVLGAVTLSSEDGRVTTFQDGRYEDALREGFGGRWQPG
jgi:diadenylate cyclase